MYMSRKRERTLEEAKRHEENEDGKTIGHSLSSLPTSGQATKEIGKTATARVTVGKSRERERALEEAKRQEENENGKTIGHSHPSPPTGKTSAARVTVGKVANRSEDEEPKSHGENANLNHGGPAARRYNTREDDFYSESKVGEGENKNTYGEPVKSEWRKRKKFTGNKVGGCEDLFTIFVDGLADYIDAGWLRMIFKDRGDVKDAFMPAKRRPFTHLKFGFVRFKLKEEAERAIKKFNGVRRHDNIMKVYMAKYGRDRKRAIRQIPVWRPMEAQQTKEDLSRKSYRQVLTGEKLNSSSGDELFLSQSAMEAIKSRVAALELEVARLQHALSTAMSDGKMKVDVGSYSGDRVPAGSGEGSEESSKSGVINEDESRVDWVYKKEILSSGFLARGEGVIGGNCDMGLDLNGSFLSRKKSSNLGQDCVTDVSPKKGEKVEFVRSLSGERWPAGSGEGSEEGSMTGVINDIKAGDDWVSKKVDQATIISDMDEGLFDDRCDLSEDEEALNELELYRLTFDDNSKDRKYKEKPSRVEMEGDRKSCFSVNIRKRTKGQKKKKVESRRRKYAFSRWLGVKRRFVHVFL